MKNKKEIQSNSHFLGNQSGIAGVCIIDTSDASMRAVFINIEGILQLTWRNPSGWPAQPGITWRNRRLPSPTRINLEES